MNTPSSSSTGYPSTGYYDSGSHASRRSEERYDLPAEEGETGEHRPYHEDEPHQRRGGYRESAGDRHEEPAHESQEPEEDDTHGDIYDA
jgi:hypothetical protein